MLGRDHEPVASPAVPDRPIPSDTVLGCRWIAASWAGRNHEARLGPA